MDNDEDDVNTDADTNSDLEPQYESSPDEATSLKPGLLNRKRVLVVLCIFFAVVVCGGLILNTIKSSSSKKKSAMEQETSASSRSSNEFLTSLRNNAIRKALAEQEEQETENAAKTSDTETQITPEPLLPPVSMVRDDPPPPQQTIPAPPQNVPPPPQQYDQQQPVQRPPLVPQIEGSLFSPASQSSGQNISNQSQNNYSTSQIPNTYGNQVSDYNLQNDQANKQAFYYSSDNSGTISGGQYLVENSLWVGTIIPGVLETAINTDLPGNVRARVTQNIYDSKTGRKLLIPQGTLLIARYNSSISYAQHRVQIVWDTLIRPDGFQLNLQGAPGVDQTGMSGQDAKYRENWFEYLKAAGIIALFTIANAKIAETAAQNTSDNSVNNSTNNPAANIAAANAQVVNQLGENIISRALNVQPTLTVNNGTLINIMLNSTLYLPPVDRFRQKQKYFLE